MKVMNSGSHFLPEPEIWRRSLVDREDHLAVRGERERELQKSLKEEERVLPWGIKGQAAPRLSLHLATHSQQIEGGHLKSGYFFMIKYFL